MFLKNTNSIRLKAHYKFPLNLSQNRSNYSNSQATTRLFIRQIQLRNMCTIKIDILTKYTDPNMVIVPTHSPHPPLAMLKT